MPSVASAGYPALSEPDSTLVNCWLRIYRGIMRVRLVESVKKSPGSVVTELSGSWGEVDVRTATEEIRSNTRRYRAIVERKFDLEIDDDGELVLSDPITSVAQLPSADPIRDPAEGTATNRAVLAATLLRLAVVVASALVASMGHALPISLRWSLGVMAIFALLHLLLDLIWFSLHRDSTDEAPLPRGEGLGENVLIPTSAAVIALVTGIGKNITLTGRVGVVAVAASILLGIASVSLQGARINHWSDRVMRVLLINIVFFAFAFGLLCLALSLAL
jgi:hypothetical protein